MRAECTKHSAETEGSVPDSNHCVFIAYFIGGFFFFLNHFKCIKVIISLGTHSLHQTDIPFDCFITNTRNKSSLQKALEYISARFGLRY